MICEVLSPDAPLRNSVETMRAVTADYSDSLLVAAYYYYIGNGSIIIDGETTQSAQKILFDGYAAKHAKLRTARNEVLA